MVVYCLWTVFGVWYSLVKVSMKEWKNIVFGFWCTLVKVPMKKWRHLAFKLWYSLVKVPMKEWRHLARALRFTELSSCHFLILSIVLYYATAQSVSTTAREAGCFIYNNQLFTCSLPLSILSVWIHQYTCSGGLLKCTLYWNLCGLRSKKWGNK